MQLVNCVVKLAGKHYHQVSRVNVSVPEYLLLVAIHGSDAIEPERMKYAGERGKVDGQPFDELEHLRRVYGGKTEILQKIDELFPGAHPRLVQTFAEIGLPEVATPEIVAAFDKAQKEAAQKEAEKSKQLRANAIKREAAKQALEDAAEEENELIRPPAPQGRKTPAAMLG